MLTMFRVQSQLKDYKVNRSDQIRSERNIVVFEEFQRVFQLFDKSGDGFIDAKEIGFVQLNRKILK